MRKRRWMRRSTRGKEKKEEKYIRVEKGEKREKVEERYIYVKVEEFWEKTEEEVEGGRRSKRGGGGGRGGRGGGKGGRDTTILVRWIRVRNVSSGLRAAAEAATATHGI